MSAALAAAQAPPRPVDTPPAGVRGFVYIEPFEIRCELMIVVRDVDEGRGLPPMLDRAVREDLLTVFRGRLADACRIRVDEATFTSGLQQLRFIAIDPELGPRTDEREAIPIEDALVGAVFAAARDDFPRRLEIEWGLFPSDENAEVPVAIEVRGGGTVHSETLVFTRTDAAKRWDVPAVSAAPRLRQVAAVARGARYGPYVATALLVLAGIGLAVFGCSNRAKDRASVLVSAALALVLAGGTMLDVAARPSASRVNETQARGIIEGLLANIYHAFAFRDESTIFDTLAQSVDGPLLEQLYLDIRRGLELEESGGPRVKVLQVALVDCAVLQASGDGIRARVVWTSTGDVSHWGHSHRRRNQYRGELRVRTVEGRWKVTGVEILEEERT